jgi:hypothetical protein
VIRPASILAVLLALLPVPARAKDVRPQPQEEAPVHLTLLSQSLVVTSRHKLRVTVLAANRGEVDYADLELKLWLYDPARSRTAYAAGLEQEPPTGVFLVAPFAVERSLPHGESQAISIDRGMPELAARAENALYPMKLQLESNGVPVGILRSSVTFVAEQPLVQLNVSPIFVLDEGIQLGPRGEFTSDVLERSIAPGGRLESVVSALEDIPVQATLVVSPMLLVQLEGMTDGYRREGTAVPSDAPSAQRARQMLDRLRALARRPEPPTEVVALPFAGPSVPSLVAARLEGDLARQIGLGQVTVKELLGVQPTNGLFRPPGGLLTPDAVRTLADLGIEALIVDPGAVPPPGGLVLSPPGVAQVEAGLGRTLQAVAPDPQVAARLGSLPDDPRLRARWAVGDLTALYFERPSVDRGVAVLFQGHHDRTFLTAVLRSLQPGSLPRNTAWLRPVRATRLLAGTEAGEPQDLDPNRIPRYSESFLQAVGDARESIAQLDSMTVDPTALSERLRTQVLVAQARDFLRHELAAQAFLDAVQERVQREFDKVEPPTPSSVTLTSRGGVIPVTIRNLAGYRVRIRVVLESPRLEFLEGDSQEVILERPVQAFTFPVRAQTTGRFPVTVRLETPGGASIGESRMVVRSTAYNVLALVTTLGAALFLAAWWARRFLPRPRT